MLGRSGQALRGRPSPHRHLCYKDYLEPITHFLTGAVLGRAGFNRKTALATATMTLAAEAPDLDIFWQFKGRVAYFAHHRGFTHSFLGLFLVSGLTVAVMYLIWLIRGKRTSIPDLPPRWGLLFLLAYLAGLSHILLDFTNNYGVRPFWPFWEKWYSWDITFILEPPLLALLIAGLVVPAFIRRTQRGFRTTIPAIMVLTAIAGLWALRAHQVRTSVYALQQQVFRSEPAIHVSVYPYWTRVSRFGIAQKWLGVVETRDFYLSAGVNIAARTLEAQQSQLFPKPPETPATLAAKQTYLGRVYLDWARYPLLTTSTEGDDAVVRFQDLRFDYPQFRGRNALSGWVELNQNLQVVREGFGNRAPTPPTK